MPKENQRYWERRYLYLENQRYKQAAETNQLLVKLFEKAKKQIDLDLSAWYARYAKEQEMTFQDARKLLSSRDLNLFKMDVDEYIEKAKDYKNADKYLKLLNDASARVRISRLQALQLQIQSVIEELYQRIHETVEDSLVRAYEHEYLKSSYRIQKGIGVGVSMAKLDKRSINRIILKPWVLDGENFSERIWANRENLVNKISQILPSGFIRGLDVREISTELMHSFDVKRSYAERLVVTEMAFIAESSVFKSYSDIGIEKYRIVATLDKRTSTICRDMDGKEFKITERMVGTTAPPFHPWCRTTTVPIVDEDKLIDAIRVSKKYSEWERIPATISYRDWEKKFVTK